MTISTVGFDGSVSEGQWSELMRYAIEGGYRHSVANGFGVAPTTNPREVSVAAGTAYAAGVLVISDAAVPLTVGANAGSTDRLDLVVLTLNWSTNTALLEVVAGSGSVPTPTQDPGNVWQIPLAVVKVRPGVGTLVSSDVTPAKPLPRVLRVTDGVIDTTITVGAAADAKVVGTVKLADPGWPYRVRVTASAPFAKADSGFGRIFTEITNNGSATRTEGGQSGALVDGGASAQLAGKPSIALTGVSTVDLYMVPVGMANGDGPLTISGSALLTYFSVEQIPA
jgi:hypothetical protein